MVWVLQIGVLDFVHGEEYCSPCTKSLIRNGRSDSPTALYRWVGQKAFLVSYFHPEILWIIQAYIVAVSSHDHASSISDLTGTPSGQINILRQPMGSLYVDILLAVTSVCLSVQSKTSMFSLMIRLVLAHGGL